jgi:hypothetical protein
MIKFSASCYLHLSLFCSFPLFSLFALCPFPSFRAPCLCFCPWSRLDTVSGSGFLPFLLSPVPGFLPSLFILFLASCLGSCPCFWLRTFATHSVLALCLSFLPFLLSLFPASCLCSCLCSWLSGFATLSVLCFLHSSCLCSWPPAFATHCVPGFLPFILPLFLAFYFCYPICSWLFFSLGLGSCLSAFAAHSTPGFLSSLLNLFLTFFLCSCLFSGLSVFVLCFLTSLLTLFLAFHLSSCLFLAFCLRYSLCSWPFGFASDFVPGCFFWSCLSSWLSALTIHSVPGFLSFLLSLMSFLPSLFLHGFLPSVLNLSLAFCLSSCPCSWLSAFATRSVSGFLHFQLHVFALFSGLGVLPSLQYTPSVPGILPFFLSLFPAFCILFLLLFMAFCLCSWLSSFTSASVHHFLPSRTVCMLSCPLPVYDAPVFIYFSPYALFFRARYTVQYVYRGDVLERNWDKNLRTFAPCYS